MADPIMRVNYFKYQLLHAEDFALEQTYHMGQQQRHNKLLHSWGIAGNGLDVTPAQGNQGVVVSEGVLYDRQGRELVNNSAKTLDLSTHPDNQQVFITIRYDPKPDVESNESGTSGFTRLNEDPHVDAVDSAPPATDTDTVVLAAVSRNGKTVSSIDKSMRVRAGIGGGDLQVSSLKLTDTVITDPGKWPDLRMRANTAGQADFTGSLSISAALEVKGNLSVGGTITGKLDVVRASIRDLAINSQKLDDNAVIGPKIKDGEVTDTKLAKDAVTTLSLKAGAVTIDRLDPVTVVPVLATGYLYYDPRANPPQVNARNVVKVDLITPATTPGNYKITWGPGANGLGPYVATVQSPPIPPAGQTVALGGRVVITGSTTEQPPNIAGTVTIQVFDDQNKPSGSFAFHLVSFA